MILFLLITATYAGILTLYIPQPESLKADKPTLFENFQKIKASLFIGVILLYIFLLTSNLNFIKVDKNLYVILGLANTTDTAMLWPLQAVTHLLIHANLYHVVSNVAAIGIASAYERRVGSKRFTIVLMVGACSSVPSILFYPDPVIASGISGGVFVLGAAYFTDHENLTIKEWIYAILGFLVLAVVFSFNGEATVPSGAGTAVQVDYLGHALGAIGGIVYCRLRPFQSNQPQPFRQ